MVHLGRPCAEVQAQVDCPANVPHLLAGADHIFAAGEPVEQQPAVIVPSAVCMSLQDCHCHVPNTEKRS